MSSIKHLLFLLIALIGFGFLSSCSVQEVEVGNIKSFNIVEIGSEYITIDISVPIKNPNNFSFTIKKVNLDVHFNGYDLGKIDKVEKVTIKKQSNEVQHLVFKLKLKDIMKGSMLFIPALLTNRAKIKVTGYIKASTYLLFSKKIKVDYNKKTKISKDFI